MQKTGRTRARQASMVRNSVQWRCVTQMVPGPRMDGSGSSWSLGDDRRLKMRSAGAPIPWKKRFTTRVDKDQALGRGPSAPVFLSVRCVKAQNVTRGVLQVSVFLLCGALQDAELRSYSFALVEMEK